MCVRVHVPVCLEVKKVDPTAPCEKMTWQQRCCRRGLEFYYEWLKPHERTWNFQGDGMSEAPNLISSSMRVLHWQTLLKKTNTKRRLIGEASGLDY